MIKDSNDINDNEIRVISTNFCRNNSCASGNDDFEPPKPPKLRNRRNRRMPKWLRRLIWVVVVVGVLIIIFCVMVILHGPRHSRVDLAEAAVNESTENLVLQTAKTDAAVRGNAYTAAVDTVLDGRGLLILSAQNAVPSLVIGSKDVLDQSIVLATQAADIRGDNGEIAGAFVLKGDLISKGSAKAGFCAILNGEISIGVADATPAFEKALAEDGYFFRQYPLVVGGQIVENRPLGKSIRKALAEVDGRYYVMMSKERLTLREFSQLLIDAGVQNAISLVGSTSSGYYVNKEGEKIFTGIYPDDKLGMVSYIAWKQTE